MFNSEDNLKKVLQINIKEFEELYSFYKINLITFVNYEVNFDSFKEDDIRRFNMFSGNYKTYMVRIKNVISNLDGIENLKKNIISIESKIKNNIFLVEHKNNSFTASVVKDFEEIFLKIKEHYSEISTIKNYVNSIENYNNKKG